MPLMQPAQSQWINPQSQFASQAQGYSGNGTSLANLNPPTTSGSSGSSFMSPTSGFKSIGQFAGNGFSFPQSQFVNNIGSSLGFGTQTGAPLAGTIGPTNTFTSGGLTSSSLSSTLGAAGIGAFAGSFLGKIGGNSTGGSIGGGAGAGIGMAVGGPVGAVVGGLLGGIGGGFFGSKKKPNPAGAIFDAAYDPAKGFSGGYFGGKHTTDAGMRSYVDEFSQYAQQQAKLYGITLPNTSKMYYGYDVNSWKEYGGKPGQYRLITYTGDINKPSYSNGEDTYFTDDPASKEAAYKKQFNNLVRISGKDPATLTPVTTAGSDNGQGGGISIKHKTQGSFNSFMKTYRGGTNATTPSA